MTKKKTLPEKGSEDAQDIYTNVGIALSYWEASDDAMLGLFKWLCEKVEPVAIEAYLKAPRKVRTSMLKYAVAIYKHKLTDEESDKILRAIAALDKLSPERNEIAHGQVVHARESRNFERETSVSEGYFLLPAYNELETQDRSRRFVHTEKTIVDFRENVRNYRWILIECTHASQKRWYDQISKGGSQFQLACEISGEIAKRKLPIEAVNAIIRPIEEWKDYMDYLPSIISEN